MAGAIELEGGAKGTMGLSIQFEVDLRSEYEGAHGNSRAVPWGAVLCEVL